MIDCDLLLKTSKTHKFYQAIVVKLNLKMNLIVCKLLTSSAILPILIYALYINSYNRMFMAMW